MKNILAGVVLVILAIVFTKLLWPSQVEGPPEFVELPGDTVYVDVKLDTEERDRYIAQVAVLEDRLDAAHARRETVTALTLDTVWIEKEIFVDSYAGRWHVSSVLAGATTGDTTLVRSVWLESSRGSDELDFGLLVRPRLDRFRNSGSFRSVVADERGVFVDFYPAPRPQSNCQLGCKVKIIGITAGGTVVIIGVLRLAFGS
ncbi:MAG: hypothetical protein GY906_36955 [bacterium]|nr:hypothetical protein [bacterium]